MKILFIILIAYSLNAQDIEPVSMSFTYKGTPININQSRFQQNDYLLGWQWCGHKKNIKAMKTNVVAGGDYEKKEPYESYETTNYTIAQSGKYAKAWNRPFIQAAAWLTYEPGLIIPENESFVTITDDPSNPIFGFKYITEYGTLTFTNDADDFNKKHYRLALYEDSFSSATESQVLALKDPWPNDVLYTKNSWAQDALYTGKKWYLTINLRRTSSSFNGYSSTISDNTPVLSIVLPYTYDYLGSAGETGGPGTEEIKFLELPETNLNNVSNWYSDFVPSIPIGLYIPTQPASATISPLSRTLTITREMIPNWLDDENKPVDINIFASFITDSDFSGTFALSDETSTFHNPKYTKKEVSGTYTPFITSQGIEVYYHKTLDVAIDWIRLGNDTSQELLTGKFESGTFVDNYIPYGQIEIDDKITAGDYGYLPVQEAIQGHLSTIGSSSYTLPGGGSKYEFFRFYGQDTESENPMWWGMLRYWNLVTDGLAVTRDQGFFHPKRYYYYTKCANRYLGLMMYINEHDMNTPYMSSTAYRDGDNGKALYGGGNLQGFNVERSLSSSTIQTPDNILDIDFGPGAGGVRSPNDTINSDYETGMNNNMYVNGKMLKSHNGSKTFSSPQDFVDNATYFVDLLKWEKNVNLFLFKSKDALYDSRNWWMNFFINFNAQGIAYTQASNTFKENYPNPLSNEEIVTISTQSGTTTKIEYLRPKTSEEVRRLIGTSLILGAKGLLFDRDITDGKINTGGAYFEAFSDPDNSSVTFSPTDEWGYLYQDELGADFTNPSYSGTITGDISHFNQFIDPEVVKRQYKVKEDRVYLGHKSTRTEIKKQFEYVLMNEDELLNLDLISWYTRGFFKWENQHPYFGNSTTHTIANKFFDIDEIRTKKIYQPSLSFAHNYDPPIESSDSAYFDVTMLKPKSTPIHSFLTSNTFYVGVQNRRTDPLILNKKTSTTFQEVQFYSGAEFDVNVQNGGNDIYGQFQTASWWKAKWWERFGARELIMPINLKPYGYGKFLTFTDLGYEKFDTDPHHWYLTEPYNDVIDTILNYSNSLHINLLPGQFKIIKGVQHTVFTKDDECYVCDLVDNFDAFKLELTPSGNTPECCWDMKFIIDYTKLPPEKQGCTFTDIPIKITLDGANYQTLMPSFSGSTTTMDVSSKSVYLSKTFSSSGTYTMGELCFNPDPFNTQKARISVLFGKDTLESFIGCNRRIFDDIVCTSGTETEVENCCEKLGDVSSTYIPPSSIDQMCCTEFYIDDETDAECIYNVALELGNNYWYNLTDNNSSITFSMLPAEGSKKVIGKICQEKVAGIDCEEVTPVQKNLLFLGADGEIICKEPVTIYTCCENMGGPGGDIGNVGQPPYKKNFEVKDEDKATNQPYISKEENNLKVRIIPNPSDGVFKIEFKPLIEQELEIKIVDLYGNTYYQINSENYKLGKYSKSINLKDVTNGVYFVNLSGDKSNVTIPIIINK